jgi:DNA-directed RNA polymerase III subunit RPC2
VGQVKDRRANQQDKWELLPAFLKVKGLVKQHLDSFNFFVEEDIKAILKSNQLIQSDIAPNNYIKYNDIRVCMPARKEVNISSSRLTPMECRLTDTTYAGEIKVDIEFTTEGGNPIRRKGVVIGRMPIMLRSNLCHLMGRDEGALAKMGECPLDPGGYFVVKGTEKVILVQEQLSKNRILVMADPKNDTVTAEVTSYVPP